VTGALKLDLSPRLFAGALLATVAVLAGAGWFLVVSPKHDRAATLQSAIENDQARLASAQHAAAQPGATDKAEQGALRSALPDALAMPQLVIQLNALADQSGVTLDSVSPAAPESGAGYVDVPLTVVVDGRYFSVEKFLHLVRNQVSLEKAKVYASGRLFDVAGIQLDQTEPAPNVTGTLQMKAFYFSPTSAPPAPTTTTTDSTSITGS
jgi:Tfp pilus assembly protein PilO